MSDRKLLRLTWENKELLLQTPLLNTIMNFKQRQSPNLPLHRTEL